MSARMERLRATFQRALQKNADFFNPHTLSWDDGTVCDCGVADPNLRDQGAQLATRLAERVGDLDPVDLRLATFVPGQERPNQGASTGWQGGTLTLVGWSQVSDLSGTPIGICRWSAS